MAVNQKANADSLWAGLQSIGRGAKAAIEAPSNLFRSVLDNSTNLATTGKTGTVLDKPLLDTSAGKYADKPLYESIVPSRPQEYQPLDMSGFQSNVTGAGDFNNGLYNNNRMSVQNPLSVGFIPTQVDSVAKAPIGVGNTPTEPSTPAPTLYASNQASNANGAPTVANATPNNYGFDNTGSIAGVDFNNADGQLHTPTSDFADSLSSGSNAIDTTNSLWDNFTDFSSKDATKNSLGNISTGVNVGSSLFNAYSTYQSNKAKANYQNRIAGLYEKQYADTEARRAQAQANYDASVPK